MSTELTTAPLPKAIIPVGPKGIELNDFEAIWRFSNAVVASGFAPKGMDKTESVLIAVCMALDVGLSPMAALQNIAVINGRPSIYGDAALALVRGSGLLEAYEQTLDGEGDARRAVITSVRKGGSRITSEFSVADAKKAKLWGKAGPWSDYPDRMLVFRARGFNLRDNFGDVLKGFMTAEEARDQDPGFENARDVTPKVEVRTEPAKVRDYTIKPENKGPSEGSSENKGPAEGSGSAGSATQGSAPAKTETHAKEQASPLLKNVLDRLEKDKIPHDKFLKLLVQNRIIEPADVAKGMQGIPQKSLTLVINNWKDIADSLAGGSSEEERP